MNAIQIMKYKSRIGYVPLIVILLALHQSCLSTPCSASNQTEQKAGTQKVQVGDNKTENDAPALPDQSSQTFEQLMQRVHEIEYVLKEFEKLDVPQNFLNTRIKQINDLRKQSQKPLLTTVNTAHLIQVERAFIKGTVDLGNNLYERATVEYWQIDCENQAIEILKAIEKLKEEYHWEEISKSPITCFRIRNTIIFITPGGFYMLDKVSRIEDFLKKNL